MRESIFACAKNIIILLFLVSNIQAFGQSCPPVVQLPFSGNPNDISGNANNGIVIGATLSDDRFNNPNSAYDFDGLNDRIDLPDDFDFPERTFSLWVNG